MNKSLERSFAAASKIPKSEQNSFAAWIMAELESERRWDSLFESSQDELATDSLSKICRGAKHEY